MIYVDVTSSCKSPMNTGVQRVVRGLFRVMKTAGMPVTPLVWDPRLGSYCNLSTREQQFLEQPFAMSGGRALAVPGRIANPIPIVSKALRQVRRSRARVDLLARLTSDDVLFVPEIFQDNRIEFFAQVAARKVAVFHDAIAARHPDITPPARRPRFHDYLRSLASFDAVVAVSRESADDLGEIEGQMIVAGWPVDDAFARNIARLPNESKTILCVGSFEPRKNHLTLLKAVERLEESFELVLIGRTTKHFGARVLSEIRRLQKLGRKIEWRRHVDDESLRAAYDEARFTVFPSFVEGYGLPILESLARARPCICGGNGALGEIARGGGSLIIDQTNANALAMAMRQLFEDDAMYRRLQMEAVSRKFERWPDYLNKLQRIFVTEVAA